MKKNKKSILIWLGMSLILMMTFNGAKIAFADEDIAYMFSSWLNNKTVESLNDIDYTISAEQINQTNRLKSEIDQKVKAAEEQYQAFIENEKRKRVKGLENYATRLIEGYEAPVESGEEVIQKLECIKQKAEIEMNIVLGNKDEHALIDCGPLKVDPDETKAEEGQFEDTKPNTEPKENNDKENTENHENGSSDNEANDDGEVDEKP
jgi:hypothetical protein